MTTAPRALLLGNSTCRGYLPHVTAALAGEVDVCAGTGPCWHTDHMLAHLDELAIDHVPADDERFVLHVNCGLHDLAHKDIAGKPANGPAVPLARYRANVERIITEVLERTTLAPARLVWALNTPVIDERHQSVKSFIRREADVQRYNEALKQVCAALDVKIHDLHAVAERNRLPDMLTSDGVHYTDAGYRILADSVVETIRHAQTTHPQAKP